MARAIVTMPHEARRGEVVEIRTLIAHPMETGYRRTDSGEFVRSSVRAAFPLAKSVIVCVANYNAGQPRSIDPAPPGSGWIAYDPTNGTIGGLDLIRVAVTRDISQAVPISGSFVGSPGSYLGMTVDVTVESESASPRQRRFA